MTDPAPAPDPGQQHIDLAAQLAAQAAEDYDARRSAAAANNTALAQVHALIACARLLAEHNRLISPPPAEPAPEPDPAPETDDAPTDPDLPA